MKKYRNLKFIKRLVADMTQDDPLKRPTMAEAVERFAKLRSRLWQCTLRSRLVRRYEFFIWRQLNDMFFHVFWTMPQVIKGRPAIPSR